VKAAVPTVRLAIVVACCLAAAGPARAQTSSLEVGLGTSALLVLGPMSGSSSFAVDATARGPLARAWQWNAGVRVGVSPPSPELFAGVAIAPRIGAWQPSVGLELGLSTRGDDDAGSALLREARDASRTGLSPVYFAFHGAPLSFWLADDWRFSVLELQLGTHVAPLGRYVRAQLGIVSLGMRL
jgi:hypothetical protein